MLGYLAPAPITGPLPLPVHKAMRAASRPARRFSSIAELCLSSLPGRARASSRDDRRGRQASLGVASSVPAADNTLAIAHQVVGFRGLHTSDVSACPGPRSCWVHSPPLRLGSPLHPPVSR